MKRIFLCLLSLVYFNTAQAVEVISSIKPIHLIAQEITSNSASSSALLGTAMSPHDYSLRPSDVKKLRSADLVIWFGPDLEAFMSSAVSEQNNKLTISEIPDLDLFHFEGGHHDHDGHHHGNTDPHFWLGPKQAATVAKAIAARMGEIDPANKAQYNANLDAFLTRLQQTTLEITANLKSVHDRGYFVFHDGYGYFERTFNLNHLGHFTVSPERKPGAKTLIEIKQRLAKGDVACVFSEPQFTPAVINTVTRGSNVHRGVIDPLASDIENKPGAYFVFLKDLSQRFETCLKK
ncbi:zinc ABC transporter substrate-binding protein [Vibrio sp. UCD-FRSSP16_10]|uniref:zinc ABC transporter substrate-binding protein ZnuA n=1 Tax=unclassified Vibrio TaxID=2614977 RepID=UPI0007FF450D|nr:MULTISPECIES: zinc ABC transporter substrate-binding protein ZnuA [unclassified Vibrio]OBT08578.1 zinc ABC transporter substrate-binding protein [Vibrio sp. UCD-FRSSP16_30]OBT18108.1 zinc ABC transporter substrate-binding protein [Vibrio sp. UCD-FRSSP16_10]